YELAECYASFRERGAGAVIRLAEARAGKSIPSALRVILARCLAARPSDRYDRALELAEDLDRWRSDRPMAYATEPFWTQTLPRVVRRKRTLLSAAMVALTFAVGLITTRLVMNASRSSLMRTMSRQKMASWDNLEELLFQYRRPGSPRLQSL